MWSDQGIVTCAKLATGEVVWSERVEGEFLGSPVCTGDKLVAVDKSGKVFALAAGDKFQLLGTNALEALCQSTPAIAGGRMFIRTGVQLHCVGAK